MGGSRLFRQDHITRKSDSILKVPNLALDTPLDFP